MIERVRVTAFVGFILLRWLIPSFDEAALRTALPLVAAHIRENPRWYRLEAYTTGSAAADEMAKLHRQGIKFPG